MKSNTIIKQDDLIKVIHSTESKEAKVPSMSGGACACCCCASCSCAVTSVTGKISVAEKRKK